ncbi:MAG TPA: hypothetical protein VGW12_04775 [Pyrinomonadaceae bacterium]|nr:hypothetical protein [Pyrinomonadaceae bacterium]
MTGNALLGELLSEHKLAGDGRGGWFTCGCFLIVPFIFGLWGLFASLTYARHTVDADVGFYFSIALVAVCVGLFGLFALVSRVSPVWLKKYRLEIYEHGFVKKDLFKTRTCLWSEIRKVNPMLLVYDKASRSTPPGEFGNLGEDTKERGVYEVYKNDGSKITISRRYTDIERLDERLIPFCVETPDW